jgi:murein DD-endopeptidase MepM/ murein hydrolase activator NlpD
MTKFALLLLCLSTAAMAQDVAWPGGVAKIDLGPASGETPIVKYNDKRVLVAKKEGRWQAVVGVNLDATVGSSAVTLADGSQRSFEVAAHAYREQHLEVAPGYVSLSEENLARVGGERKIIDAALNNWRSAELDGVSLSKPVPGSHSSSFGSRRFFNGEARSPHSGMDISANAGVPILAPRAGVVTAIGDYYFNGNTVIVDHGQGYVSMYCHLSEIGVEEGQTLSVGESLGLVGATGRVTGAHLHFGTYINGNAVDPALLLGTNSQ